MGMAASQARFLGLTARKTNVEYEGQQINQQRTTLANQSANYYNDLLGMSVPTPPSVDSFTKTVYTFNDGALTNSVTALIAQNDGLYTLSYLQQYEDDFTPVSASTSIVTISGGKYMVGSVELRNIGDGTTVPTIPGLNADGSYTGSDEYLISLENDQRLKLLDEEKNYAALLTEKYGEHNWCVRYVQDTSTGIYKPYFYNQDELTKASNNQNNAILSNINCYTMGTATKTSEMKGLKDCAIEKDSTGRYINISIPQYDANGNTMRDANGIVYGPTYSLTTNTVTDQDAYNDAMNQYEYDKQLYDQAIEEINAKIEIIQAQDKNLELRLKQLDTEQDAISNEMEAVQKVIEKNVDNSFKTFG